MTRTEWNITARWGKFCDITSTDIHGILTAVIKKNGLDKARPSLIDLGCGTGSFMLKHGLNHASVLGVDFSFEMLAVAASRLKRFKHVQLVKQDLYEHNFRYDSPAALVACLNVSTSPSIIKRQLVWKSIKDSLCCNGLALIVVPSFESMLHLNALAEARKIVLSREITRSGLVKIESTQQKYFLKRELIQELKKSGLKTKYVQKIWYPWAEEGVDGRQVRGVEPPWDWLLEATHQPQ